MQRYLKPTAPIAADALLPSDPGAALLLAQDLLQEPLMSNHNHGLWGYHGETEEGRLLTVQSTGLGGPSAAAVLGELAELGVRRAIRVGICAPGPHRQEEDRLLVVERALAGDGTSAALGAGDSVGANVELTRELARAAGAGARTGVVVSVDVLDGRRGPAGAVAADLESAALFALGERLELAVAALLSIETESGGGDEDRTTALGRIARAALASAQERSPRSGIVSRS